MYRGEFRIRSARGTDYSDVKTLLERCGLPVSGVSEFFEKFYVVVEHNGLFTGCAGLETQGEHGLLRSVAVAAGHRRRGIGELLVNNRLAWGQSEGLKNIYLLTIDASGYFERFGFISVNRQDVPVEIQGSQEFSQLCPESAICMKISLLNWKSKNREED